MITRSYGPMLSDEYNDDEFGDVGLPPANWKDLIASSMQESVFAPSDEAFELVFEPYEDEFLDALG